MVVFRVSRTSDSAQAWKYCYGFGDHDHPLTIPVPVDISQSDLIDRKVIRGDRRGMLKIGVVGRDDPVKNHKLVIEILGAAIQKAHNWRVDFIGAGDFAEVKWHAERLGLTERIAFHKPRRSLTEFYLNIDVFLLTSAKESRPVSLIEAQMLTQRCVVSDVVDPADFLEGPIVSVVNVQKEPSEWVKAIDDCARRSPKSDAVKVAMIPFSTIGVNDKWLDIYRAAADKT